MSENVLRLVAPLGFLGLIGLLVLILIYIIKPNYQQRIISSTYIWQLSLKKKRKRIPISKFRNILLFLCQLIVITICTFVITQPFLMADAAENFPENIVIIDASASMQAMDNKGITRFTRAVSKTRLLGQQTIAKNGLITVIIAGGEAYNMIVRTESEARLNAVLNKLVENETMCTFGEADVEGAMSLAETVLEQNPMAEVIFYTAKEYAGSGKVTIVNVSDNEWNAAIVNCTAEIDFDINYYVFAAEIASYNKPMELTVYIEIADINFQPGKKVTAQQTVRCLDNNSVTVSWNDLQIFSFSSVYVEILEAQEDSFLHDNVFYVYGGINKKINMLYVSSLPNPFVLGILRGLRDMFSDGWDIVITEAKPDEKIEYSGYDFYIFEHTMPRILNFDGIILLINPNTAPENSGIHIDGKVTKPSKSSDNFILSAGVTHPLMDQVNPERITVSEYLKIGVDSTFEVLMYSGDDPVLLVRNEHDTKIVVLSFSVNNSTLPVVLDFAALMHNMFAVFLPYTLSDYVYDVGQPVRLNARSPILRISGPALIDTYDNFPIDISVPMPGIYTLRQTLLSGEEQVDKFYVRIAAAESDFTKVEPMLKNPFYPPKPSPIALDLLIYLAAILVALLYIEQFLNSRNQF